MRGMARGAALGAAAALAAVAAAAAQDVWQLQWIGTYESQLYDEDAAEKVSYDPVYQAAVITNAFEGKLDVVSFRDPTQPIKLAEIDVLGALRNDTGFEGQSIQGVEVAGDLLVASVYAANKTDEGVVALFSASTLELLDSVPAGFNPDHINTSPDGSRLVVVGKGSTSWPQYCPDLDVESPSCNIELADLPFTVTIIDLAEDHTSVTGSNTYQFDLDASSDELRERGVRLYGPARDFPALDLSPEDAVFAPDGERVLISFQENNALAAMDASTGEFLWVDGYGFPQMDLDPSDEDDGINIASEWGDAIVRSIGMPDKVDVFELNGETYLLVANEGTSREIEGGSAADCQGGKYCSGRTSDSGGNQAVENGAGEDETILFDEAITLQDVNTTCDANDMIRDPAVLGSLQLTNEWPALFDRDGRLLCDSLYAFGGRSFSVFKVLDDGLEFLWTSAGDFERTYAETNPTFFNSNDDGNDNDARSTSKGPEPEVVAHAALPDGTLLALVGLEKISGVMVYDISDPAAPVFQDYFNRRNFGDVSIEEQYETGEFTFASLDVGPESIVYIPPEASPLCAPMVLVANPMSGTTTAYKLVQGPPREGDGHCEDEASCAVYAEPPAFEDVNECPAFEEADGSECPGGCEECMQCVAAQCARWEPDAECDVAFYQGTRCNRVCASTDCSLCSA